MVSLVLIITTLAELWRAIRAVDSNEQLTQGKTRRRPW